MNKENLYFISGEVVNIPVDFTEKNTVENDAIVIASVEAVNLSTGNDDAGIIFPDAPDISGNIVTYKADFSSLVGIVLGVNIYQCTFTAETNSGFSYKIRISIHVNK